MGYEGANEVTDKMYRTRTRRDKGQGVCACCLCMLCLIEGGVNICKCVCL